ncbi:MAG: family 16 glycoside hydrolase [Planctomycetota bacterium]
MRRTLHSVVVLTSLCSAAAFAQDPQPAPSPGYTDTPKLPDGKWRVHDAARPHPPVVAPGAATDSQPAPADAIVLFDGQNLAEWRSNDGEAKWTVADGCMTVNGTGDVRTAREFGDCQLHVEWASPETVQSESQGRGNSGVFFFERYEIQILDSYENVTYADGQAASLYGQHPPMVNVCRKPGQWQTYDIVFRAPKFGTEGGLIAPARATVFHNGVLVHLDRPLWGATAHRSLPSYKAHEAKGPIRLQDHGNPVRFRNLWIRELDLSSTPAVPTPMGSQKAESKTDMDHAIAALMQKAERSDDAITVQHILISFQGAPRMQGVTRSKDEAKVLAENLWNKAQAGADFATLMKAHSNDPGAGEYPMTKATRGTMVKAFGDVGFRLEVGEIGVAPWNATSSPYGWHVIKRVK